MIKGIVFDLDGVYFLNGKENFIKNLQKLGVSEDEAKRVFLKSEEMNLLYKTGNWSDEQYWQWAAEEWKLKEVDLPELMIDGYEVNEEVVMVVKEARSRGYKTLVCSNNFPVRINGLNKKFDFLKNFDAIVVSYEVQAIKPSKLIFEKLIEKSGLMAEEIYLADDNESNIQQAKEMRIKASFYSDFDTFVNELRELGVNI